MPKDTKDDPLKDIPHIQPEPRPDFSKPPSDPSKPHPLPKDLQATLDNDETLWQVLSRGEGADSTSTDYRYAAYASRVRTILLSAHRYVAYTSDIGESFRPIAHPYLIKGAYGVSWAYLMGDVAHEGYKAYLRNQAVLNPQLAAETQEQPSKALHGAEAAVSKEAAQRHAGREPGVAATAIAATKDIVQPAPGKIAPVDDYRTVMAQRAIFQGLASMGLPAFTIHSIVKYGGKAMKNVKNQRLRSYGPIGLGLAAVPALPYMFDDPVEHAVEWVFHKGFGMVGMAESREVKEKEL